MTIKIQDTFGANKLLTEIAPHSHFIDIRVRYNGEYYWFEGDFLKQIFKQLEFYNQTHTCKLENFKQNESDK